MNMLPLTLVSLCLLASIEVFGENVVDYSGYRALTVRGLRSGDDVDVVNGLVDDDERDRQVMLMSEYLTVDQVATLLVAPEREEEVLNSLKSAGLSVDIQDDDVGRALRKNEDNNVRARSNWSRRRTATAPDFFMTGDEINDYMSNMIRSHPDFLHEQSIGFSTEGRPIKGILINATTNPDAKHVFIHSGIHAREWITHGTVIYIMHQIMTASNGEGERMKEKYIWHFFPNINPDGYHHSHTVDRFWRKNRRVNNGSECMGVDLNRNWDKHFGVPGASPYPCSQVYHGPYAFSEPETRAVRDEILRIGGSNILFYLDVHAYSQMLLIPYGGTSEKPEDYNELRCVANEAKDAIKEVSGRVFQVGTPPDIIYGASGGALDWVKAVAGVKFVYSPELRPTQSEPYGFDPPPSWIHESGEEFFAGLVAALDMAETIVANKQ